MVLPRPFVNLVAAIMIMVLFIARLFNPNDYIVNMLFNVKFLKLESCPVDCHSM